MRARFARSSTSARLWAAAALSTVPMGLVWSPAGGSSGHYLPGPATLGSQSPARVFLLGAAVALLYTATRTRTPGTRRVARLATAALLAGLALAAAARSPLTLVCAGFALALVVGPAWNTRSTGGVLASSAPRR